MPKKLTIQNIKERLMKINKNINILSDGYKNAKTKLKCQCLIDNHIWYITWNDLQQGYGCPKCGGTKKLTIEEIKEQIKTINPNIEILNNSYINAREKLRCRCLVDNHIWNVTWSNLKNGRGCPKCSKNAKLSLVEINIMLKKINPNVKILSDKYVNSNTKLLCKCLIDGHRWYVQWNKLQSGRGCPKCNQSKGEKRIDNYLNNNDIQYKPQYEFNDLLSNNNNPLRFDFAVFNNTGNLECLIEYDGEFHYKKYFDEQNFETLQCHDNLKNNYCIKYNISLLRIPYWEFENIEEILKDYLKV